MSTCRGRVVAVIPARYASSRFPGKPLCSIAGKPMIQWVWEMAVQTTADDVVVATDDHRIRDCVNGFGGTAIMTATSHPTGTDRIAEVARGTDADILLNIQGDEPLVPPAVVDELIELMASDPAADMGTIAVPFSRDDPAYTNPNVAKVVIDDRQRALYFSRSPLPYYRDNTATFVEPLRHWGIYAFRRETLFQFVSWPPGRLERCEQLEQLRALENGVVIRVLLSDIETLGVDVPDDVQAVESILRQTTANRDERPTAKGIV